MWFKIINNVKLLEPYSRWKMEDYRYQNFLKKRYITDGWDCQNSLCKSHRVSGRPHQLGKTKIGKEKKRGYFR